jgi:hypothetical protein
VIGVILPDYAKTTICELLAARIETVPLRAAAGGRPGRRRALHTAGRRRRVCR